MRRVLHGKHEEVNPEAFAADKRGINRALETTLGETLGCLSSPDGAAIGVAPGDGPGISAIGHAVSKTALTELQTLHPAGAYLRLRVTDYGETPRRWEGAYITFEVVTTLAIASGLYVHRVTRPVAAAYLLEESVEELSEGYVGFWALNRLSRPVRIEADIIDGHTGQALWSDAHTGLAPWRWRNLRRMDDATRDLLLATSMRKAVKAFSGLCDESR